LQATSIQSTGGSLALNIRQKVFRRFESETKNRQLADSYGCVDFSIWRSVWRAKLDKIVPLYFEQGISNGGGVSLQRIGIAKKLIP